MGTFLNWSLFSDDSSLCQVNKKLVSTALKTNELVTLWVCVQVIYVHVWACPCRVCGGNACTCVSMCMWGFKTSICDEYVHVECRGGKACTCRGIIHVYVWACAYSVYMCEHVHTECGGNAHIHAWACAWRGKRLISGVYFQFIFSYYGGLKENGP